MFGNLLNRALSVIPKQNFTYCKYKSSIVNEIGVREDTYYNGIVYSGSVQAVQSNMYKQLGLDFSKNYIQIFSSVNINNVNQSQSVPDKILWNNKTYLVVNCNNWYLQDGWTNIIAVEQ